MREWLRPVLEAIEGRSAPLRVYFRDDDAGWDDAALMHLVHLFERHDTPIDLAVIPSELGVRMGRWLAARIGNRLGCHQHGFAHVDHAQRGRRSEFGEDRGYDAQLNDLRRGWLALTQRLEGRVDPIFTPPWNRCSSDTARALGELGFLALSRDAGAAPLPLGALRALPVHVDWMKWRSGVAPDLAVIGRQIAAVAVAEPEAVQSLGIMLHHAVMTELDFAALGELLGALRRESRVQRVNMRDLLDGASVAGSTRRSA